MLEKEWFAKVLELYGCTADTELFDLLVVDEGVIYTVCASCELLLHQDCRCRACAALRCSERLITPTMPANLRCSTRFKQH